MPRRTPRSVVSAWQTEDVATNPKSPSMLDMADELADDDFTSYDPDAFYLRATDEKGHSISPVKVNIPTNFGPAIAKVLESASNPYRNVSDMARDLIIHGLVKHLKAMAKADEEVPTDWFRMVELEQRKHERETKMQYLKDAEEMLELYDSDEDWAGIIAQCYDLETTVFPKGLRGRRDELVRKYQRRVPVKFHPMWETEG